jgi:hypothetical protein
VQIEHRGPAVWVAVTDPHGRRSERTLVDIDAAVSLVESWARQDMNSAALIGWIEPASPSEPTTIDTPSPPGTPARTLHRDRLLFGAGAEVTRGSDGASWTGTRITACVRLGPVCAGAAGRAAWTTERATYDALATLDGMLPLRSRFELSGGAGIGVGRYDLEASRADTPVTYSHTSMRLDAHAGVAITLARHIALRVTLSGGYTPGALDAFTQLGDTPPGETTSFIRGDLGLRIGVL